MAATADQRHEGYDALRHGLAVVVIERDVVRASGTDAERYLQGQLSQDVAKLSAGDWAWSLVLQPQGKLDAFVRCLRLGPEEFLLDTDAGMGDALAARLMRFRLRTRVDIDRLAWQALAVRGPSALAPEVHPVLDGPAPGAGAGFDPGSSIVAPFAWGGLVGYDLLGLHPVAPAGAIPVTAEDYEVARIEAGFPRHGAELDERTIPAEAGLVESSVSFTKGCYTGQELVARIDARGSNVPRHLRGLLLSGPASVGAKLYALPAGNGPASGPGTGTGTGDGAPAKELGRLTSVALSPGLGWVALGYVGRSVPVGATVVVGAGSAADGPEGPEGGESAQGLEGGESAVGLEGGEGAQAVDLGDAHAAEVTAQVHLLPFTGL